MLSFSYPESFESGAYNELIGANGRMRPHWRVFFNAFEDGDDEKLSLYADRTARLMTADVLAAAAMEKEIHGVIPFILSQTDFDVISAGLRERAHLINDMLSDLYGKQELISSGVLPPSCVFAPPSYLPALKGIEPTQGVFLQEYAVDVERSPDGRFWVVADWTQAPQGIGLTIKNRLVLSRVMPDVYAKAAPARIFDFFESLRQHIFNSSYSQDGTKIPSIVLLSGSSKKTLSFEEAFFARGLGIIAIEPNDLTVRGDKLYLKNIDGLKPVDVVLRRVDDSACDPLELNGYSLSGVAGLVEAVRAKTVALINPLGTGLAENKALQAFIHAVARHFNGQDLMLPSVATWWTGQDKERAYVKEHKHDLKIYDLKKNVKCTPSDSELDAEPYRYAAQERINASLTPTLENKKIVPARTRLRFHLIYDGGDYRVLSGGLAFTQTQTTARLQDIWIPSGKSKKKGQHPAFSSVHIQTKPVRTTFELTSGIADNMFWLGRNLERSEQLARVLRIAIVRATQGPEIPEPNDVATLFSILALSGHLPFDDFRSAGKQKKYLKELKDVVCSPQYGYGLYFLFSRLKDMADALHDRLSMDTWQLFTELKPLLPEKEANYQILLNRLDGVILRQNALSGLIREDMTRDHGWRFMEIGRRLERGMQTVTMLSGIDFCAKNGFEASLETLLESSDSRMTYRVRYMAVPTVPLVFDLLVCDSSNPRALIYQVLKLRQNISVLKRESRTPDLFSKELEILQDLIQTIESVDIEKLADPGFAPAIDEQVVTNGAFGSLLNDLRLKMQNFSDTLTLSCFVHTASTRQGPAYNKGKIK